MNITVDRTKILLDTIKRLLRRRATVHLHKIVNKTHAADLATVLPSLSLGSQLKLYNLIDDTEKKGDLFSELDEDTFLPLIERIDLDDIVKLTVYLVDLADFGLVNEVMASRFSSPYPARAAVQVAALPRGARVEIDAIMRP